MKKTLIILAIVSGFNTLYLLNLQRVTQKEIDQLTRLVKEREEIEVTATMYNAVVGQCDKTPLQTACMYKINPRKASEHKWIAVSRDLLKKNGGMFEYGDKVMIKGAGSKDGVYTIADTMNKRFKKKIDILETEGTPQYKYDKVLLAKL